MQNSQNEIDTWIARLKQKPDVENIVDQVGADPSILPVLFEIIRVDKGSIKFFCDKVIRLTSERQPSLVYPYFQIVAGLVDSPNNFIKWGAIITLSNLVTVDDDRQIDSVYDHLFALVDSDSMITAGNVAGCAPKIIEKFPDREPDITERLLRVTGNTYLYKGQVSPECKNIMIGHVIDCFDQYFPRSGSQGKMIEFAAAQLTNPRKAVARKAAAFLQKHRNSEIPV